MFIAQITVPAGQVVTLEHELGRAPDYVSFITENYATLSVESNDHTIIFCNHSKNSATVKVLATAFHPTIQTKKAAAEPELAHEAIGHGYKQCCGGFGKHRLMCPQEKI